MKIVQISDLHIPSGEIIPFPVDILGNLEQVLIHATKEIPDLLVIGGDICYGLPQAQAYQILNDLLFKYVTCPIIAIPGNHDDFNLWQNPVCNLGQGILPMSGHRVLFLDSSSAKLQENAWKELQAYLKGDLPHHLIFMHHPPILCGIPFMDNNYPFLETERFQNLVAESGHTVHVCCGHYHHVSRIQRGGIQVYIGPSTYLQISADSAVFQVSSYQPGYLSITLSDQLEVRPVML